MVLSISGRVQRLDRKSTRLNSSHLVISYAVFCLKKKKNNDKRLRLEHKVSRTRPDHAKLGSNTIRYPLIVVPYDPHIRRTLYQIATDPQITGGRHSQRVRESA